MDIIYLPLLSALIGAVIGSGSSILSIYLQSVFVERRERANRALQAAIEESRIAHERAKALNINTKVYPLSLYFWHHAELLKLVDDGNLNAESLRDLFGRQREIREEIDRASMGTSA